MTSFVYNTLEFSEKITSFSFLEYLDAFEVDVNVVNFVYYGKTRLLHAGCTPPLLIAKLAMLTLSMCYEPLNSN